MKKDKKIFSIFVISFLLVLFGVFVFLEYTNKNNKNVFVIGKKTIDVSVIDKYVNASFIALKDGKYGIMNVSGDILVDFIYDDIYKQEDYDDNFILVKDGTNYVFNGMGMELLNSSDKILTYNDMINRKTYYIKKNGNKEELFNEEGARLVDIKSNGLFYIVDDYAVYEKKLVNINNGEIMIANNIVLINDKYLLLYMDKEYRLYDIENNKWNFYNEMNSDKYYYEFISSDTKFIINIYGEILTENEKDVEKINDKYSISYDICKEGFNVYSNGDKISEDCYNTYKYFKNKNIIILSKSDSDDFIYNDELISYDGKINIVGNVIRVYDGLKSRYYDLENNDINIKCSKSLEATLDGYVCNNYDSAYFMNNKLEKISDDYSSISCNKDSFCLVLKNQKYGLYYKNKELIEPNYYDIKVYDNYVIADNLFAVDVYKLGNGIPLSLSEKKYSEATLYEIINVSDVIKEYDLFEIEDYIYENESMFKKYAYVVLNNKKVTGFRREILMMFKVVALNKENYDEYYFLNSLEKLKVVQGERQDKLTVGLYDDSNLLIEVLVNNKMVLYHELLHFINNRINYKEHFKVCEYDGKYYSYNNLDTLTINEQNKCKNVEVKDNMLMLDEAGTEVNTLII